MRKPTQYALVAGIIILAGATAFLFVKYQKKSADYLAVKEAEAGAQRRYSQTIDAIAEIQDSLNAISVGDKSGSMLEQDIRAEQSLGGPNAQGALDRIELLRASIQRNKDRIRQLESDLKHSGNRIGGLQKLIAQLKQSVSQKETLVAQLSGRVDSLQTEVHGLATVVEETKDTLAVRDATLEEKRREMATVFVAVGTKKDLTSSGVVIAKGGVLGIGKILQPTGTGNEAAFTPIDTDQETVVRTSAAKVQVVSAQPPSSYELVTVNGQVELHITDANAFRKVKQLVIVTA